MLLLSSSIFVQVTSVLPNRKITAPGDAAVGIAFRDTGDKHAREKIGTPFQSLPPDSSPHRHSC
jgi:hypothetical protein